MESRREKAGQASHSLRKGSRARVPGGAGEARSSQEMPCSSRGPRHLALGSVRCQEGRCSLGPNLIRRKEAFSWRSL